MSFLMMVIKNLRRRPARTGLTIAGIAVGIAAVVALTSFANGFERVWRGAYEARGTDLVITKVTSRSPLPAAFDESLRDDFSGIPEIESVAGLMSDLMSIEDAPTVLVFGWEQPGFLWDHLKLRAGGWPEPDAPKQLVLGALAAETLGKKVGDKVQVEFDEFTVSGIFDSPALVENGSLILPLKEMQRITERPGKVNFLNLRMKPGLREPGCAAVRKLMAERHPGYAALDASEVAGSNTGVEVAQAMSWATSWIALLVGAFGVTNTVLMSVFERTRELGILLAIGWKRRRIMVMILIESAALSLLGGAVGTAVGLVAVRILEQTATLRGKLEADLGPGLFLTAFAVALGLGVTGGLYPAWRASRLQPGDALRSE